MRFRTSIVLCLIAVLSSAVTLQGAGSGHLKLSVNPGRAGVFLDGKYLGPAANFGMSRTYDVAPGEHELRLVEPRYEEIVRKITVPDSGKLVIKEQMKALPVPKPPFGTLRTIHADRFAAVYVNDRFMGHVDEFSNFAQGMLLVPGPYEVKIVPAGAASAAVTAKINIEANKTTIVR